MKRCMDMTVEELAEELKALKKEYARVQALELRLDMSRGSPARNSWTCRWA